MLNRYTAQMRLPEFGREGQERLLKSNVLIVGCGALGSPVAMYLAGAGVGEITLADFDTVDVSNLHRQVFYSEADTGRGKAALLKNRIEALNSEIRVTALEKLVTDTLLHSLSDFSVSRPFDMIVDAADNPATTYLIDRFCHHRNIPYSTAGVSGWNAQVFTYVPGSFSFSDIFPQPQDDSGVLPCSVMGIAGPTAAYAAALQCAEIMKVLLGIGPAESRLLVADLLKGTFTSLD